VIIEQETSNTAIHAEELGTLSFVGNGKMAPENVFMVGEAEEQRLPS
jgi:hypothetical protein